ncbi:MAG: BamA/TamA family outer membrane protein, partial [Bacteroidia bacterium]|nr:BamA/TamA family outer membrane protein [Bacteroidia bacterium]
MACKRSKYPKFEVGITALFLAALFLVGCGVGKTIPKGSHLLKKNKVLIQGNVPSSEINAQILHRPNKRVIFEKVPIYLWAYALGTNKRHPEKSDSTKLRRKLRNDYGEPPILVDSTFVHLSADNIQNYLFNIGYFDAVVTTEIKYSKKKAKVKYFVNTGTAYRINSVFMTPADSTFLPAMQKMADDNDFFRLWWPINLNKLDDARNYMATLLRNEGYYTVNAESFRFVVDTLNAKKEGALIMVMENQADGSKHAKYHYGKVTLKLETSPVYQRTKNPDVVYANGKRLELNHYPIQPNTISRLIYIDSGNAYSQKSGEQTYQSLVQTGLFSLVDVRYYVDTGLKTIETIIDAKTSPRMAFSLEPQGLYSPQGTLGTNFQTSSQRSFGLAGILSFTNKNLGKNAENLRISSITSYEAIIKVDNKSNLLYGVQQGFNASLSLPHFNLLNTIGKNNKSLQRNSVISLSYQYEKNPNFLRSAIPASLTFQFVQPNFSWYYTPTEVSFNRNILSPDYLKTFPVADSIFISRVFTNQFLTAAKVGFIYANNHQKPGQTYLFTRLGFESSGNIHRTIRKLTESNFRSDSAYTLFGLQYFQYAKIEGEIRLKQNIDELNSIALRVNSGIAVPYGNSKYIPYDKRYFIGGSNSLRAWRPRRLGPGTTTDASNSLIDRSGEFLLEGNLEYRFTVIKHLME